MAARLLIVVLGSCLAVAVSDVFGVIGFVAVVIATAWLIGHTQ